MPLIESSSQEAFDKNVAEMIKAGHTQQEAVAAAYAIQHKNQYETKQVKVQRGQARYGGRGVFGEVVVGQRVRIQISIPSADTRIGEEGRVVSIQDQPSGEPMIEVRMDRTGAVHEFDRGELKLIT